MSGFDDDVLLPGEDHPDDGAPLEFQRTLTLSDFLLARIAEDEADPPSTDGLPCWECGADPERWKAECDVKRRIVAWDAKQHVNHGVLEILALPYADHPDYRDEWRPF